MATALYKVQIATTEIFGLDSTGAETTINCYICYTRLSNGILAKRIYQGYTKKEAKSHFKAYLKTL